MQAGLYLFPFLALGLMACPEKKNYRGNLQASYWEGDIPEEGRIPIQFLDKRRCSPPTLDSTAQFFETLKRLSSCPDEGQVRFRLAHLFSDNPEGKAIPESVVVFLYSSSDDFTQIKDGLLYISNIAGGIWRMRTCEIDSRKSGNSVRIGLNGKFTTLYPDAASDINLLLEGEIILDGTASSERKIQ